MIRESIVPVWNENLLRIEALKHLDHTLLGLLGVLMQTLILEVQKGIGRRFESEMLCGLERLKSPHLDQRWRIHEPRVGGAPIGHDHDLYVRTCYRLEGDRSSTTEDFVVRMRGEHDSPCACREVLRVVRRPPEPTSKKYLASLSRDKFRSLHVPARRDS